MNERTVSTQLYCRVAARMPKPIPNERGEQVAGQRQRDRPRQALAHHLGDRAVVEEGPAEVAAGDDAADPAEILDDHRVVQPVLLAVSLGRGFGGGEARRCPG